MLTRSLYSALLVLRFAVVAVVAVLGLAVAAGCGGARPAVAESPPCPDADVRVVDSDDIESLAGCAEVRGDLVIEGAALRNIDALGRIERVAGSVVVGPTLRLTSVGGLRNLTSISGDLDVRSNQQLGGVFFGQLARVGGAVNVDRNRSAATVSLHRLESVGGDVEISGNAGLLRVDLGRLETVQGDLVIDDNRGLQDVILGDVQVGGERSIDVAAR